MNISHRTITALAEIITGDGPRGSATKLSPYRTLGKITDFFRDFGERDLHPSSGAPSRFAYTKEKLEKFNGTEQMNRIICNALDFWGEDGLDPQHAGAHLNTFLKRDGYEVVVEERYLRMAGDTAETEPYFVVRSLRSAIVASPSLIKLSEESITEHIAKARQKIEAGDHAGAIASAYTLVEEFLKQLLRKTGTAFNENEGDIRALYKLLAEPLHLVPKNDSLESYLKAILEGLQRQIGGLFELANKASDRHARKYNPAPHHARLAVNVAFTLCEFLLESYEYQQKREERMAS
ncbi:abortive infection family protein [Agrobacterium sp. 22-226-1]